MTDTRSALKIRKDIIAMTEQHTPGPWVVNPHDANSDDLSLFVSQAPEIADLFQGEPDPEFVCAVGPSRKEPNGRIRANARLIAAAPELLAALEDLFALAETDESGRIYGATLDKARAAIAKAKE